MKNPQTISEILGNKSARWKTKLILDRCELWKKWKEIVGSELSDKIFPARWKGNILVVCAQSHSWLNELNFLKKDLLENIKKKLPKIHITDIRFELGKPVDMELIHEINVTVPISECKVTADEMEYIDQVSNEIEDEDVRESVKKSMMHFFRHKRKKTTSPL
ncbi:MAG: DUF721 domain-containing protein [Pseudomonadota bacterium]